MGSQSPSAIEIPVPVAEGEGADKHLGVDVELPSSPDGAVGDEGKELGGSVPPSEEQISSPWERVEADVVEQKPEAEVEAPSQAEAEEVTTVGEASSGVELTSQDGPKEEDEAEETNEAVNDEEQQVEVPVPCSSSPSESDVEALRERLKLVEQRFSGTFCHPIQLHFWIQD